MATEASPNLYSIGEVIARLRQEFPDISVSKVRFLESEGLVEPARTPSGYRKFAEAHLERLRHILRMQRDHYMPLKVIKDQLDAIDRGEAPAPADPAPVTRIGVPVKPGYPSGEDFVSGPTGLRMTRKEFLEAAGIDSDVLRELESHNLITPAIGTGYYDTDALAVAEIVSALAVFGIGPRHLRAFKLAADREVDLVSQVVTPIARGNGAGAGERAQEVARELSALSLRLHVALVKGSLSKNLGI